MAIAGQGALWGVALWSVDLLRAAVQPFHVAERDVTRAASAMYFIQQIGAMLGIYAFAAFSERTTRRRAFTLWFALAWVSIPVFFWGVAESAGFSLGPIGKVLGAVTFSNSLPAGAQSAVQTAAVLACFMASRRSGRSPGTQSISGTLPTRLLGDRLRHLLQRRAVPRGAEPARPGNALGRSSPPGRARWPAECRWRRPSVASIYVLGFIARGSAPRRAVNRCRRRSRSKNRTRVPA